MTTARQSRSDLIAEFRTKEILSAAADLVRREGMERLTMDRLASEAGVAKGTVYIYFKDKEELIHSLLRHTMAGMVDAVAAAAEGKGPLRERLLRIAEEMRKVGQENLEFLSYIHNADMALKKFCQRDNKATEKQRMFDLVSNVFREALEEGELIELDPDVLGLLFLTSMHSLFHWCLEVQEDPASKVVFVVDMFLYGILRSEGHNNA